MPPVRPDRLRASVRTPPARPASNLYGRHPAGVSKTCRNTAAAGTIHTLRSLAPESPVAGRPISPQDQLRLRSPTTIALQPDRQTLSGSWARGRRPIRHTHRAIGNLAFLHRSSCNHSRANRFDFVSNRPDQRIRGDRKILTDRATHPIHNKVQSIHRSHRWDIGEYRSHGRDVGQRAAEGPALSVVATADRVEV